MLLLAIDTCMAACSAAVLTGEGAGAKLTGAFETPVRGHAELIMPMVVRVMENAGCAFDELSHIAVTVGPGSFSGVRVGVAAARGLALATDAQTIGMTSLAVMAQGARRLLERRDDPAIAVAHDARREQVYFGRFDAAGEALGEVALLDAQEAAKRLASGDLVVGSGAHEVTAAGGGAHEPLLPELLPEAADLARLAVGTTPAKKGVSPLYLRAPDAKPQSGKAVPRRR